MMTGEEFFKDELFRSGIDISDRQAAQLAQVAREMNNLRDTYKRLFPWYVRLLWRVVNKYDNFLDWFYGEP